MRRQRPNAGPVTLTKLENRCRSQRIRSGKKLGAMFGAPMADTKLDAPPGSKVRSCADAMGDVRGELRIGARRIVPHPCMRGAKGPDHDAVMRIGSKLRGGGPILHSGIKSVVFAGTPPPRTVIVAVAFRLSMSAAPSLGSISARHLVVPAGRRSNFASPQLRWRQERATRAA
jgi:hypothetical protein